MLHKSLGISNIREDNFDVNMPYINIDFDMITMFDITQPSVVYIDHDMVRLADIQLYRRLNEIQQAAAAGNLDAAANSPVKRGQKEDVFRLVSESIHSLDYNY